MLGLGLGIDLGIIDLGIKANIFGLGLGLGLEAQGFDFALGLAAQGLGLGLVPCGGLVNITDTILYYMPGCTTTNPSVIQRGRGEASTSYLAWCYNTFPSAPVNR